MKRYSKKALDIYCHNFCLIKYDEKIDMLEKYNYEITKTTLNDIKKIIKDEIECDKMLLNRDKIMFEEFIKRNKTNLKLYSLCEKFYFNNILGGLK